MASGTAPVSEEPRGEGEPGAGRGAGFELALTPSGRLTLADPAPAGPEVAADGDALALTAETAGPAPAEVATLRRAFGKNPNDFLLELVTRTAGAPLPPVLGFWRTFGERYLTELCHVPEPTENWRQPLPAPRLELVALAAAAPPMRGGEYLTAGVLEERWAELDDYARTEIGNASGGLTGWLKRRSPLWHRVGRVCFHLAENKRDPEYPFAFMATYAPKLIGGRRVQYVPLGRALEEYAGAGNQKALLNLLTPVQRAAQQCPWVKALVDSGDVFHPLAWTPAEAHRFLVDLALLEASGVLVRIPDWWHRQAPRVRVGVKIGEKGKSKFGADALLDFRADLALDGEPLTDEEREQILASTSGLVFVKGRWVEVDPDKLRQTLEHWQEIAREVGSDGVSFLQALRLLAGAPITSQETGLLDGETAAWSEIHAGAWLETRLQQLRDPAGLDAARPGPDLQATLRPYQEHGVQWLWMLSGLGLGGCLADDMGLGKTVQVLALLLARKRARTEPPPPPALLVMPASLLANWKVEIERFAPTLVCRFLHPTQMPPADLDRAAADPAAFRRGADAVLTTYSLLVRQPWLTKVEWSLVVLDEAQAIRNPGTRQTQVAKALKAPARLALTGTPVENRLLDLWSIFDFLNPGLLGSANAFKGFAKRLADRPSDQYGPLRRLVGPYILRRLKTDKRVIADLPEKIEQEAWCALSRKQATLYEQAVGELGKAVADQEGIQRRGVVLSFLLRFKQICNHPAHWLGTGEYPPEDSGKFLRLRELCEEIAARQEKVLVFSQFREIAEPLAGFLATVFGRPGLVLHGAIPVGQRQAIVDEFGREDGPPFLVLSLKVGGTGLNLVAASHVIHFDRWWNPAVENQATDRAFRIGQHRNVLVHKFVCQGTIEEKIDALLKSKRQLADDLLTGGVEKLLTEMGDRELLEFVRLDVSRVAADP